MNAKDVRRVLAVCACAALSALPGKVWPITISAIGSYAQTVGASDLAGGAGTDFASPFVSGAAATQLSVSATANKPDAWRIDVRRVDGTWDSNLVLQVRRTDNGSQCGNKGGNPTGGTTYQTITTSDITFFQGQGDRCSIGVQYQLTGVSVAVPAGTYSTTVMFTIVDI